MNLKLLTAAQRQVFLAISAHFIEKGSSPSYQDLSDRLGGRSSATIHKHVHNLAALGIVRLSINGKIRGFKAAACPTCGHRKAAGKCDDPEVHTDFDATFKEMCERGKRIEQLEKKLAEARA